MKIEVGKTYMNGRGQRVRIVATDRLAPDNDTGEVFCVVGLVNQGSYESPHVYTIEGKYGRLDGNDYDLVQEVGQYDHIRKGDVVLVYFGSSVERAHFYGVEDGTPCVYSEERSPWTAGPNPDILRVKHVELEKALNLNLD